MALEGCTPIRRPLGWHERIHGYFRTLVDQERRLQGDGRIDGVPRNVMVSLYAVLSQFEAPQQLETGISSAGYDAFLVPTTHRLLIHTISSYIGIDSWQNHASRHSNASPDVTETQGMIEAESMVAMLALRNADRSESSQHIFERTNRYPARNTVFTGTLWLNASAINVSQGKPLIDFGKAPYIVLPGEELQFSVRGFQSSITALSMQVGILISSTLVPADEEP